MQSPDSRNPVRASWLALPPEPWKNGGGVTRTLAADSAGRWRVSIADITRNGPYSRFPGYDRVSVVLSGEGVALRGDDAAVSLRPRVPTAFGGDALLQSTLAGGPVRVLNLFVRRGEAIAKVTCAGGTAGHCDVGALSPEAARRVVTRLVVAADAGRIDGLPGEQGALAAGEFLLAHTPFAWTSATGNGFAVILDIAVRDGDPN